MHSPTLRRPWRPATALALAGLVALAACGQPAPSDADHQDDHDHDHELTATAWSASHEVFLEGPRLIAGAASPILLHVTDLADGTPTTGPLALSWRDEDGVGLDRTVAAGATPGVYEAEASLPHPGHWQLRVTPAGAAEAVVVDHLDVTASSFEEPHDHTAPVDADPADLVTMTKEQQWRLGVATGPVVRASFTQPLRVAATVEAPPERRVVVATPVGGLVTTLDHRHLPVLGEQVRAGEPLLAIRVPLTGDAGALAGAASDLVRTREELQLAEAELERARTLVAAAAAPARRVEAAESAVTAARARHAAAASLLAGDGDATQRVLTAPIDGVVTALHASPGQHVEAGARVLTVLDPSRVWVRGHIPETELHGLPAAPRARLGVHGDVTTACDIEGAELVYLAPEIDPASRTAAVVYAIDNDDLHLRVGQSLGLALDTSTVLDGLLVPSSALIDEHGRPVVFVPLDGERFVRRHVTVGGHDATHSLITGGLDDGDRVVTRAAWAVKLAGAGTAVPGHGHTH